VLWLATGRHKLILLSLLSPRTKLLLSSSRYKGRIKQGSSSDFRARKHGSQSPTDLQPELLYSGYIQVTNIRSRMKYILFVGFLPGVLSAATSPLGKLCSKDWSFRQPWEANKQHIERRQQLDPANGAGGAASKTGLGGLGNLGGLGGLFGKTPQIDSSFMSSMGSLAAKMTHKATKVETIQPLLRKDATRIRMTYGPYKLKPAKVSSWKMLSGNSDCANMLRVVLRTVTSFLLTRQELGICTSSETIFLKMLPSLTQCLEFTTTV
jgi:hypothetical protein